MNPSLSSRTLVGLLRLSGLKRRQFDPERFTTSPTQTKYAPRRRLHGVTVQETVFEGWPVFRLAPVHEGRVELSRTAIFLHGGGWVAEITGTHWAFAAEIARRSGREVIVPIYPLMPEATHRDVLPVLLRLFQDIQREGPVALIGDSAGANIALLLMQALGPEAVGPDLSVLISPALDLTFSNPQIADIAPRDPLTNVEHVRVLASRWAGQDGPASPLVSPLNGGLDRLGRVHVYAGTRDVLYPDALLLRDKADKATGTELTLHIGNDMIHDWPIMPTREGREARKDIAALF